MASEEALRAAAELFKGKAWITHKQIERAAEIIDREFKALRGRLELQAEKMDDWIGICEKLRAALGSRGRADCPKCLGTGAIYEIARNYRGECECRKELFR